MQLTRNISIKKVYAVEALLGGEQVEYNVQLMTRKGGKVYRKDVVAGLAGAIPKKRLKKDYPVVLVVRGKGIITKKLPRPAEINDQNVLNQVLPNANLETFHCQYFELADKLVASVVRSSVVEEVLAGIPRKNIVVETYVGDFVLGALSYLKGTAEEVIYHDYKFRFNSDEGIIDYDPLDAHDDFRLSDEVTKYEDIPAYASGVNFLTGILSPLSAGMDWLAYNRKEQQDKFLYNYVRVAALALLMATLLANDYYSGVYSDQIAEIRKTQGDAIQNEKVLSNIRTKVDSKKSFLQVSGLHNQSALALFADDVANSTPQNITLTELKLDPMQRNLSQKRRAEFEPRKIVISGECHESQTINQWLEQIKEMPWVEQAVITNYSENRRERISEFELEVLANATLE